MRKYQPIWMQLKLKGSVSLAAPPTHHRRIILAVRKEKTNDIAWKYELLEKRQRYKLIDSSEASLLTFTLIPTEVFSYSTLTIHDL